MARKQHKQAFTVRDVALQKGFKELCERTGMKAYKLGEEAIRLLLQKYNQPQTNGN